MRHDLAAAAYDREDQRYARSFCYTTWLRREQRGELVVPAVPTRPVSTTLGTYQRGPSTRLNRWCRRSNVETSVNTLVEIRGLAWPLRIRWRWALAGYDAGVWHAHRCSPTSLYVTMGWRDHNVGATRRSNAISPSLGLLMRQVGILLDLVSLHDQD